MEEFNNRLLMIFEEFSLNASTFADRIGVQRSSLSHILSGRNKPSLDFILKIYEAFPNINLSWLTLGEGNFLKNDTSSPTSINLFDESNYLENKLPIKNNETKEETDHSYISNSPNNLNTLFDNENEIEKKSILKKEEIESNSDEKKIETNSFNFPNQTSSLEQIVFFYKDGTFKIYHPK